MKRLRWNSLNADRVRSRPGGGFKSANHISNGRENRTWSSFKSGRLTPLTSGEQAEVRELNGKKEAKQNKKYYHFIAPGRCSCPNVTNKRWNTSRVFPFFWWFFVVFWCRRSGFPRKRRNLQSSILKCAKCKIDTWPLFEFIQVFWVQRWSQQREMVFYGASSTTSDNPEEKQTCVCHTCCAILVCSLFCF